MPVRGGLYTGLSYFTAPLGSSGAMDDFLESLVNSNKTESVVSVFMAPRKFFSNSSSEPQDYTWGVTIPDHIGTQNTGRDEIYYPRNKKLLTYPYSFIALDTLTDSHTYKWEDFHSNRARFRAVGTTTPNPEIGVAPLDYNGSTGENWTESVILSGFPQVAWPVDSYMAWLAQKAGATALSIGSQAVGVGVSAYMGNAAGVVQGALGIAQNVNSAVVEATRGNTSRGNQSGGVATADKHQGVYMRYMGVTIQYAAMIDDFFDRYGYSDGTIHVPSMNARKEWTYVKTDGCHVFGNLPDEARVDIEQRFDAGVTFWKNADNVGNYALDNTL